MLRTSAPLASLIFLLLPISTNAICENTFKKSKCDVGCWNEGDAVLPDGLRVCVPVGKGFASGSNANDRRACPSGTYSNDLQGGGCSVCPAGSASGVKASSCSLCPPGFYQDRDGQSTCKQCLETDLFSGYYGANSYRLQDTTVVCAVRGGNIRASSRTAASANAASAIKQ